MRIITQSAWAKINLGLKIIRKRSDGFHDITTVFQRISLCDVISIFPGNSGISYTGPKLTEDPRHNLSVKAAEMFYEIFDLAGGAEISLTKRIPTGAGLGGGSSDAATVLRILCELHGKESSDPKIEQLAQEIGSDVPFFLKNWSAAIGEGRGERLSKTESLPQQQFILILWPGFQISTARAYQEFDNTLTEASRNANLGVRSVDRGSETKFTKYSNDFEYFAFSAHPLLNETCEYLLQAGALSAGLSGSGSSLFAIFDGESNARKTALTMRPPWQCFLCRPC